MKTDKIMMGTEAAASVLSYKYKIMDMDGTMANSLGIWQEITAAFLRTCDLPCEEDYIAKVRHMRFAESAAYTAERYGLRHTPEEIIAFWSGMAQEQYDQHIQLKAGVVDFIKSRRAADVRLAICTSSERPFVEGLMGRYSLLDCFETVVCASEELKGKACADIWLKTCSILGAAPEECIVFEDSSASMRGAKSAGMEVVIIEDEYAEEERHILLAEADYYFQDYSLLLN